MSLVVMEFTREADGKKEIYIATSQRSIREAAKTLENQTAVRYVTHRVVPLKELRESGRLDALHTQLLKLAIRVLNQGHWHPHWIGVA